MRRRAQVQNGCHALYVTKSIYIKACVGILLVAPLSVNLLFRPVKNVGCRLFWSHFCTLIFVIFDTCSLLNFQVHRLSHSQCVRANLSFGWIGMHALRSESRWTIEIGLSRYCGEGCAIRRRCTKKEVIVSDKITLTPTADKIENILFRG
jgi:hypothetical protein